MSEWLKSADISSIKTELLVKGRLKNWLKDNERTLECFDNKSGVRVICSNRKVEFSEYTRDRMSMLNSAYRNTSGIGFLPENYSENFRFETNEPLAYISFAGDEGNRLLYISGFEINRDLRRKGIAFEIQQAIYSEAKNAGYRFVAGQSDNEEDDHIVRFMRQTGRSSFKDLKPELIPEFEKVSGLSFQAYDKDLLTFKLLEPKDQRRFLNK